MQFRQVRLAINESIVIIVALCWISVFSFSLDLSVSAYDTKKNFSKAWRRLSLLIEREPRTRELGFRWRTFLQDSFALVEETWEGIFWEREPSATSLFSHGRFRPCSDYETNPKLGLFSLPGDFAIGFIRDADELRRGRARTRPGEDNVGDSSRERAARRRYSPIIVACIAPVRRSRRVRHSAVECRNN